MRILQARELSAMDRVAAYTGIPRSKVDVLHFRYIATLIEVTAFMENTEAILYESWEPEDRNPIGRAEYAKIERAKQLIASVPEPLMVAAEVIKLYTGDDITGRAVPEVIAMAYFFTERSADSLKSTNG